MQVSSIEQGQILKGMQWRSIDKWKMTLLGLTTKTDMLWKNQRKIQWRSIEHSCSLGSRHEKNQFRTRKNLSLKSEF